MLDWALANFSWFTNFKEAFVQHLNWFKSDHMPLLLRLNRGDVDRSPTSRFRFIAAWITDESFKDMIKKNWCNNYSWTEAISNLTDKIKEWNKEVFGNICKRKRELTNRLNDIDRPNPNGLNSYLNDLQETLWKEYEKTLLQEEILWCHRMRHIWLQFGDKNTNFFHASSQIRKKRNRVEALKNNENIWVTDKAEIKTMASEFFRKLYSSKDQPHIEPYPLKGLFPILNNDCLSKFEAEITSKEIKDAVFSMRALKAPGPNGLHALFFQSQWDILGESVCKFVKDCFQDLTKIDGINITDVILIPKVENPDSIKQFGPIALCNVIYKTITKVIANRIKPLLSDIISPTQCSFVPGRHSTDNIIIAQEAIHTMGNKKGKKGFMAIKVDLEKAYDRLNWDFLNDTMKDIGFSDKMITVIMICVYLCRMRINWNGEHDEEFSISREIRSLPIFLLFV